MDAVEEGGAETAGDAGEEAAAASCGGMSFTVGTRVSLARPS
jgi:hypothetical protein